jgi:TRAP-type C4-dicarboxylate transport system permease small subunit
MIGFVSAVARFLIRVAAVFLLAMVAINVIDVGLRTAFNAPIFGTYEVVELLLAAVAFLAIPEAFMRNQHITIELIDQVIPDRAVDWLRAFGTLCALVFVGLLGYHMIQPALDNIEFNDITMDLEIPLIWKAILVMTGIGASILTAAVLFRRDLSKALGRNVEQAK